MGAHSTIRVSRSKARIVLMQRIMQANDETLEEMMDVVLYDQLYNCTIVNDNGPNDDDLVGP